MNATCIPRESCDILAGVKNTLACSACASREVALKNMRKSPLRDTDCACCLAATGNNGRNNDQTPKPAPVRTIDTPFDERADPTQVVNDGGAAWVLSGAVRGISENVRAQ